LLCCATPAANGAPIEAGTVYYVATPIGNLEDITLRAVRTLREVEVIASEDTRVTSALLRHLGIGKKRLVQHHDHNLEASVPKLLQLLRSGSSVAVVSDAGTPGVSDPGLALAAACGAAGVPVVPVPGPCAAVAALSVAGVGAREFVFAGFIPRSSRSRREKVAELAVERRAIVLYEAPHRLLNTLGDLASAGAGERSVVVARELTKMHEEFHRGSVSSALRAFSAIAERDGKVRGEFTLVVGPLGEEAVAKQKGEAAEAAEAAAASEVGVRLAQGMALSRVAKEVAAEFGVPKTKVYAEALRQRDEAKRRRGRPHE
jgi:16S rRNA (cytidine1402-2'-O)-methyltransferase